MKFAMLYSCGKDSALALSRMIRDGHTPVCLITTYNTDADRSWFHGVTTELLDAVSQNLAIPMLRCYCTGETYEDEVERCLVRSREMGAEAAVFGDIDIENHRAWNRARCEKAGLECVLPLWQQSRSDLVTETIDIGIKAAITCVDLSALDDSFLGETLDETVVARIAATGADICGENGEYHSFVYDGPNFISPIELDFNEKFDFGTHSVIGISPA